MNCFRATASGPTLQTEVFCELCRLERLPGDEGWQHHVDEVEEVEVSWANGDEGVVRHFATRQCYDLCPDCAIQALKYEMVRTR